MSSICSNFENKVRNEDEIDDNTNDNTNDNADIDTNDSICVNIDVDIKDISKPETILSIDIGKKNLGFTIYNENEFTFGIFDITQKLKQKKLNENIEGRNIVLIKWLRQQRKKYNITKIVVEKQVIKNVVAMCIQSCIITFALMYKLEITTFDPKNKFKLTGDQYDSKRKEHKKLAIKYAINTINYINPSLIEIFNQYEKQDDISDSIVMALMSHAKTNLDQYKEILKSMV